MKNIISLVLSQEGKNMVIAILLIGVCVLGTVVYKLNQDVTDCVSSKEVLLIEFNKKAEERAEKEAEKYEERLRQLEEKYRTKEEEVKTIKAKTDEAITESKHELNKIKNNGY